MGDGLRSTSSCWLSSDFSVNLQATLFARCRDGMRSQAKSLVYVTA